METTKNLITATYAVSSESDNYSISANVKINANGEVEHMDSGTINKGGAFIASFGYFGANLNVNYNGLTLDEKNAVNTLIEEFKASITNN